MPQTTVNMNYSSIRKDFTKLDPKRHQNIYNSRVLSAYKGVESVRGVRNALSHTRLQMGKEKGKKNILSQAPKQQNEEGV